MVQKSKTAPNISPRKTSSSSPARGRPPGKARASSTTRSPGRPRKQSPGRVGKPRSPARKVSPERITSPAQKSISRARKEETSVKAAETAIKTSLVVSPKPRNPLGKSPLRSNTSVTKSAQTYYSERVQRPTRRTVLDTDSDSDSVDAKPQKSRLSSYKPSEEKVYQKPFFFYLLNTMNVKLWNAKNGKDLGL